MKLGPIEVSNIERIVINRRHFFMRVSGARWAQQTDFDITKSKFIRSVPDHVMMLRLRSYLKGRKFRTHRIFVSGDTVNVVKREVPLVDDEARRLGGGI